MKSSFASAVIGACILGVSGFVSLAGAQPCLMRDGTGDPTPRLERMAACLDLSDQQIDEIQKLWTGRMSDRATLRTEMMRIQNELRGEMLKDAPDLNAVKKLAAKRGEIQTKMQVSRFETQLAMREILTPQQRDRWMAMRGSGMRASGMRGSGMRGGFRDADRGPRRGKIGQGRGWCDGTGPGPRSNDRPRRPRMW
jgi:Spy/CpxP family protein refolding chaperone